LGKTLVNKYIASIKPIYTSFSEFKEDFIKEGEDNGVLFTREFQLALGTFLIQIMMEVDMIKVGVKLDHEGNNITILEIPEEAIPSLPINKPISSPLDLPMIVTPKPYAEGKLGGVIL
jgi:hypothetical protein